MKFGILLFASILNFLSSVRAIDSIFLPLVATNNQGENSCSQELADLYRQEMLNETHKATLNVIRESTGYEA